MRVTETRLRGGILEARLEGAAGDAPGVEVIHDGGALPGVTLSPQSGGAGWLLRLPLPPAALSDGMQVLAIRATAGGEELGRYVIAAGAPAEDDLRAEVQLLRSELDLLKRAVRRHLGEGAPPADPGPRG